MNKMKNILSKAKHWVITSVKERKQGLDWLHAVLLRKF